MTSIMQHLKDTAETDLVIALVYIMPPSSGIMYVGTSQVG